MCGWPQRRHDRHLCRGGPLPAFNLWSADVSEFCACMTRLWQMMYPQTGILGGGPAVHSKVQAAACMQVPKHSRTLDKIRLPVICLLPTVRWKGPLVSAKPLVKTFSSCRTTPTWQRRWAASSGRPKSSTAGPLTPATWKCWPATARGSSSRQAAPRPFHAAVLDSATLGPAPAAAATF